MRNRPRTLAFCRVFLIAAGIASVSVAVGTAFAEEKKSEATIERLSIEITLERNTFKATDPLNVRVVFRNLSDDDLMIPLGGVPESEWNLPFIDFMVVGDVATNYVTSHGVAWNNPIDKPIKFFRLGGRKEFAIMLKNAIELQEIQGIKGEQFRLIAVYRDCSIGYPNRDPKSWKGVVTSPPVTIKRIEYVPNLDALRDYAKTIGDRDPSSSEAVDATNGAIDALESRNPTARREAAIVLSRTKATSSRAVPRLIELLKDEDQSVRDAAGEALKNIDPEAAKKAGLK